MISLCIISRKEDEESLLAALQSVAGYVDEIVVVDTSLAGSLVSLDATGENKERKAKHASDYGVIKHCPFKWTGSFADARNFSFEQASHEVIFWMDSDDTVLRPENLAKLAKHIEDGKCDWIYLDYIYSKDDHGNVNARHWKPRLIRKGSGHWVGRVHEDLVPDISVIQEKDIDMGSERVVIVHHMDEGHARDSAERNLAIQLKEIGEDGEKVDARTLQYAAMSYQALGKYEEALPLFLAHMKASGSIEDKYWSALRISFCLNMLGKHREALTPALDSLKAFPQWSTSYFRLAETYDALEEWPKVIEWTLAGLEKKRPDTLQVTSDLEYGIFPLGRLAYAYLQVGEYALALDVARQVQLKNPSYPPTEELLRLCREALRLEGFVDGFLKTVSEVRKHDRVKAAKLFDLIPAALDDDVRIQRAHGLTVPPKVWPEKSIVIYCGKSLEEWSYPSQFTTGIGGSEEAVINMSEQLAKMGYAVTVYNRCGDMKGEYNGVEYLPWYHMSPRDRFDTLIVWRDPAAFMTDLRAKRKYLWLHDIAYPEQFNEKIVTGVDKVMFLSQWHRANLPDLPDGKAFVTNNGINPDDFEDLPPKRPNSLIWSSSYDRGLLPFLKNIWPLIRKEIPDVTLDVAYGWQNIERQMAHVPHLKALYEELAPMLENTPGVTHHGRLPHRKLAALMGECMAYPYASEFGETCNITSQKCQAAGCYVITTSQAGGTSERVRYGKVIHQKDIYTNGQAQRDFSAAVVLYLQNSQPEPEKLDVKDGFSWETTAKQWVKYLL